MKKCPYCGESIQNEAKKCRHCGEWLNNISETNTKKHKGPNPILRFFKYVLFFILSYLSIRLFQTAIGLLLAMFGSLSTRRLIFLIIFFGGLFFGIRSILAAGIGYLTKILFKTITNKKTGRIIFFIILIIMTIDKLISIWRLSENIPNIIKVIYSILIILLCAFFFFYLEELVEDFKVL